MKKLYWRPTRIMWQIHVLIATVAILGILSVEYFKIKVKRPHYSEKIEAARIMKRGMDVIKHYRIYMNGPIDREVDPLETGMIGKLISPITSNTGVLEAKQATVNPNWAAVMVHLLRKAGVKKGDTVAAGFSGSFPALNLATLAAAEALDLRVVAITSAAASTWGANVPELSWLDMERILKENNVVRNRSVAASLGGTKDRAVGMGKDGREMLRDIINRNGVEFINLKDENENLAKRMDIYFSKAEGAPIEAFVNVGGGTISVGTKIGKKLFHPGLNRRPPARALVLDSVMSRFAKEGVPMIHMTNIRYLAEKYGIPFEYQKSQRPGDGPLFSSYEYNQVLVIFVLAVIVIFLFLFMRMGYGYRLFQNSGAKSEQKPPEPMV